MDSVRAFIEHGPDSKGESFQFSIICIVIECDDLPIGPVLLETVEEASQREESNQKKLEYFQLLRDLIVYLKSRGE